MAVATSEPNSSGGESHGVGDGRAMSAHQAGWSGSLDPEHKVVQLVSRITFGPRPGDLERVRDKGLKAFLDEQLHPERLDDSALQARLANLPTLSMSTGELMRKYPAPNQFQQARMHMEMESTGQQGLTASHAATALGMEGMSSTQASDTSQEVVAELGREGLLRAVYSERQLEEVMVQFWMNHFNIFAGKGPDKWMLTSFERDTIRPHALGKFEDLLVATARSPAMLFYLDNWMSAAPGSNPQPLLGPRLASGAGWRRFGGGLMPAAFAAGDSGPRFLKAGAPNGQKRGLNENYGRELMELHTLGVDGGYTQQDVIELARCLTGWTVRRPREEAEFFFNPSIHDDGPKTVLGYKIAAGRGIEDGLEALHILATHPSTARFVSQKLCRRFVADNPPISLVERASHDFANTNGDVRATLKTILSSSEFYSEAAYRVKVKSPLEMAASTLRAFDADTDAARPLIGLMARMGEPPFRYQAPAGYADLENTWISSSSLLARLNFATIIVSNRVPGTRIDFASAAANVESPASMVDDLSRRLTGEVLSASSRQAILTSLQDIQGQSASAAHSLPADEPERFATLVTVAALVIGSPEFQRR
jgi:uncharacterized protein (DUF1800 family)